MDDRCLWASPEQWRAEKPVREGRGPKERQTAADLREACEIHELRLGTLEAVGVLHRTRSLHSHFIKGICDKGNRPLQKWRAHSTSFQWSRTHATAFASRKSSHKQAIFSSVGSPESVRRTRYDSIPIPKLIDKPRRLSGPLLRQQSVKSFVVILELLLGRPEDTKHRVSRSA